MTVDTRDEYRCDRCGETTRSNLFPAYWYEVSIRKPTVGGPVLAGVPEPEARRLHLCATCTYGADDYLRHPEITRSQLLAMRQVQDDTVLGILAGLLDGKDHAGCESCADVMAEAHTLLVKLRGEASDG